MLPWAKVCQRTDGDDYLCFDFSCDALHSPCNYSMQLDFSLETSCLSQKNMEIVHAAPLLVPCTAVTFPSVFISPGALWSG